MDEKIRLYMLITITIFLIAIVAAFYWFFPTAECEKKINAQYVEELSNYTCVPKTAQNNYEDTSCLLNGTWYPSCPNKTSIGVD